MYKSYKFRLYPDKKELELINKTFGSCRFIYNYYLSNIKEKGYKNAYTNIKDYVNNLKYEYPFLGEIDSIIIMVLDIQNIKVDMIKIVILLIVYMVVIKVINMLILN